jgi:hypothetical protein
MGLLDALFDQGGYGGQGGGLLDLIRGTQMQQQNYQPGAGFPAAAPPASFADRFNAMPGAPAQFAPSGRDFSQGQFDPSAYAANQAQPINVGGYQMPRIGNADQYQPQQAMLPPNAQPTQGLPQQTQPMAQPAQDQQPLPPAFGGNSFGGNLGAGLQSFVNTPGGLVTKLLGGGSALFTGERTDPQGISQQNLKAQYDSLRQALITNGETPQAAASKAMIAAMNPEAAKTIIPELFTTKEKFQKTGVDGLGKETYGFVNERDQTINGKSLTASNAQSGGGLGDMNKSGAEYLATLPKEVQGTVRGMLDGTIQPPSSFAAAKPYWQGMIAAAKNADPSWDENKWASRHKMSTDVAASGNSSMGGILSNGKSAFKHLAEYTESAADLGNTSHNFPLGGAIAHAQNYVGNTLGGSDTNAKIKAINDNLGHYGQESTKFYAGTGGGVEERMNALKEMNPTTTSSAEMAAYAAKEKGLMLDRLREKESQIRDVMGEAYLKQHPVFTPELQRDIARIDGNIAKLKGDAPNQTKTGVTWSVVK